MLSTPVLQAAAVTGRIFNGSQDSTALRGLMVELLEFKADRRMPAQIAETTTDQDGKFRFVLPPAEPTSTLLASTVFLGVRYFSPPLQANQEPLPFLNIAVYDTLQSTHHIQQLMHHIFIQDEGATLSIRETRVIDNPIKRAVLDVWHTESAPFPTLRYSLPPGARNPSLPEEKTSNLFVTKEAIFDHTILLPGSHRVTFQYEIPWKQNMLELAFSVDYSTRSLNVFNASHKISVQSEQLTDQGAFTLHDQPLRRYSADSLAVDTPIRIRLQRPVAVAAKGGTTALLLASFLTLGLLIAITGSAHKLYRRFSIADRLQKQKKRLEKKMNKMETQSIRRQRSLWKKAILIEGENRLRERWRQTAGQKTAASRKPR